MSIRTDRRRIVSYDPATGEPIAEALQASAGEVDRKVSCARSAFEGWRAVPLRVRLAAVGRLRAALSAQATDIARSLSRETGRPLQESLGAEVLPTLAGLEFLIRQAPALLKPLALPARGASAVPEPYGVIGVIGTWNYPLFLNLVPICQALAAGCTVVWKPSELAVLSALATERLFESAQIPPGVVEIAYGDGKAGQALARAGCGGRAL